MLSTLNNYEEEKKTKSKKFYKERVDHTKDKIMANSKLLKKLEKKEREIFERLKNTYSQQEREIQKMESVMKDSKQCLYKRKPASPEHNRMRMTAASSNFQMSPKKKESVDFNEVNHEENQNQKRRILKKKSQEKAQDNKVDKDKVEEKEDSIQELEVREEELPA